MSRLPSWKGINDKTSKTTSVSTEHEITLEAKENSTIKLFNRAVEFHFSGVSKVDENIDGKEFFIKARKLYLNVIDETKKNSKDSCRGCHK